MYLLIIEGAAMNKRPLRFFIRLENEFGYDASNLDVKLPLKVIASVSSQTELFLNAVNNNVLEEIPEEERVTFYDGNSDIFSQPEEIEAEQPTRQAQPSLHQPPTRQLEVTELAEPIFLVTQ
uniref:Uncharacterized protein n=1 Tax=Romanomermis culicivorax TaxID=13658 RepID=A0A915IDP8_ROMCU